MNKRYFQLIPVLFIFLINSCADEAENLNVEISVNRPFLTLAAVSGYEDSVTVTASGSWTIDGANASWVSVNPANGAAGKTVVYLTVTDASSSRTGTLSVKPTKSSSPGASITVEQKAYNADWKKTFGGSGTDLCENIIALDDGYLIIGATKSFDGDIDNGNAANTNYYNLYVVKIDFLGNKIWGKSYGSSLSDSGSAAVKSSDGGYYIGGFVENNDNDVTGNFHTGTRATKDYWIIKLDANGNKLWDKCYGGTEYDLLYSMTAGPNDGIVVAGDATSVDGDLSGLVRKPFLVMSLDSNGEVIWKKTFDTGDWTPVIACTSDNGYIMIGTSSEGDVLVTKMDQNGEQLWTKTFAGSGQDTEAWSVIEDDDKGILITGLTLSSDGDFSGNDGTANVFVLKLNEMGEKEWIKFYGGKTSDSGRAIVKTDDGFFIAGITYSSDLVGYGKSDYFVMKIEKTGRLMWQKTYGGSGVEELWGAAPTPDKGIVLGGYTSSADHDIVNPKGGADIFIVKIH